MAKWNKEHFYEKNPSNYEKITNVITFNFVLYTIGIVFIFVLLFTDYKIITSKNQNEIKMFWIYFPFVLSFLIIRFLVLNEARLQSNDNNFIKIIPSILLVSIYVIWGIIAVLSLTIFSEYILVW
jgi:hypothetical protein